MPRMEGGSSGEENANLYVRGVDEGRSLGVGRIASKIAPCGTSRAAKAFRTGTVRGGVLRRSF
jgi:hypothetical protein